MRSRFAVAFSIPSLQHDRQRAQVSALNVKEASGLKERQGIIARQTVLTLGRSVRRDEPMACRCAFAASDDRGCRNCVEGGITALLRPRSDREA